MNNYSYVQLYYIILYVNVNRKYKNKNKILSVQIANKEDNFLILFSYNAVFADILAIVFTRLALTLTNEKLAVFVLVKLKVAHICIGFLVINIIPASITQISHQLSIPSSSFFSGLPTATVSLLSFIIGIIRPGIPDIDVVVLIIWRTNGKSWSNEVT